MKFLTYQTKEEADQRADQEGQAQNCLIGKTLA